MSAPGIGEKTNAQSADPSAEQLVASATVGFSVTVTGSNSAARTLMWHKSS